MKLIIAVFVVGLLLSSGTASAFLFQSEIDLWDLTNDFIVMVRTIFPALSLSIDNLNVTGILRANEAHIVNVTEMNVTGDMDIDGYLNVTGDIITDGHIDASNGVWVQGWQHPASGYYCDFVTYGSGVGGGLRCRNWPSGAFDPFYLRASDLTVGDAANNFEIYHDTSNKDLYFQVNDGGVKKASAYIDSSDNGKWFFVDDVDIDDHIDVNNGDFIVDDNYIYLQPNTYTKTTKHIVPAATNKTIDLGTPSKFFRNAYFEDYVYGSPFYLGDALADIERMKPELGTSVGDWAKVDHSTYNDGFKVEVEEYDNDTNTTIVYDKLSLVGGQQTLVRAVQQLNEKIKELEAEIAVLNLLKSL